jgi:hypothetical protein
VKRSIKPGNPAFVSARHQRQWHSQEVFAEAYERAARAVGIRASVSPRQVRRWESARPPWPHPDARMVLQAIFGLPLESLGFTAPYDLGAPVERTGSVPSDGCGDGWEDEDAWGDSPEGVPGRLKRLVRLEAHAVSVSCYETILIPGLLQSPGYALSVIQMRNPTIRSSTARERMSIRMQRSERLMRSGRPAWFVVSEAALYQPIGGLAVLAEQMAHLLRLTAEYPQVSVQVLPLDATFVVPAPCLLLEVAPGRTVAWLGQFTDSVLVESPDEVLPFRAAFERLSMTALPTGPTLARIDERRRALCAAMDMTAHRVEAETAALRGQPPPRTRCTARTGR